MMQRVFVVAAIFGACFLLNIQARPEEMKPEDSEITKVLEQAKSVVEDLSKNLPDSLKVDPKQAVEAIQKTSAELAGNLNKILDDVSAEISKQADGAGKVLSGVAENLKGIRDNLEKEYPEATKKAKEIQEQVSEQLGKLLEQGKVLAENMKGDLNEASGKLQEISKKVIDATMKAAEDIKKNVEQAPK